MKDDMNIFVVEDDDLDAEILERGLRNVDASVSLTRARDGVEALDMLMKDAVSRILPRPYFILLDINMPRMNGHELLAQIRANEDLKDALVFVFTTSSNRADIDRAYRNNANGYIVKPQGSSGLKEVLNLLGSFWKVCEHPVGRVTGPSGI